MLRVSSVSVMLRLMKRLFCWMLMSVLFLIGNSMQVVIVQMFLVSERQNSVQMVWIVVFLVCGFLLVICLWCGGSFGFCMGLLIVIFSFGEGWQVLLRVCELLLCVMVFFVCFFLMNKCQLDFVVIYMVMVMSVLILKIYMNRFLEIGLSDLSENLLICMDCCWKSRVEMMLCLFLLDRFMLLKIGMFCGLVIIVVQMCSVLVLVRVGVYLFLVSVLLVVVMLWYMVQFMWNSLVLCVMLFLLLSRCFLGKVGLGVLDCMYDEIVRIWFFVNCGVFCGVCGFCICSGMWLVDSWNLVVSLLMLQRFGLLVVFCRLRLWQVVQLVWNSFLLFLIVSCVDVDCVFDVVKVVDVLVYMVLVIRRFVLMRVVVVKGL